MAGAPACRVGSLRGSIIGGIAGRPIGRVPVVPRSRQELPRMDPLSSLVLSVVALAVWAYVTYTAVRRGVRDGFRDRAAETETEGGAGE